LQKFGSLDDYIAAETLSEEDDDMMGDREGIHISAMPELVSDFVPSPGGPFSALTPSMWPQDILHRLSNPVCVLSILFRIVFSFTDVSIYLRLFSVQ